LPAPPVILRSFGPTTQSARSYNPLAAHAQELLAGGNVSIIREPATPKEIVMHEATARLAEPGDFSAIMALYRQLQPDDPVLTDGKDQRVFEQILASAYNDLIVADDREEVIGTCYLNVIPNLSRSASPYAIIENVVTDSARRNQGIGQLILQFTLNRAWSAGCYKVMLQTGSKREATHAFYRACGFRSDVKTAYIAYPSDSADPAPGED
jgi:GNAT superfamily N-acetyltransferase